MGVVDMGERRGAPNRAIRYETRVTNRLRAVPGNRNDPSPHVRRDARSLGNAKVVDPEAWVSHSVTASDIPLHVHADSPTGGDAHPRGTVWHPSTSPLDADGLDRVSPNETIRD